MLKEEEEEEEGRVKGVSKVTGSLRNRIYNI